MLDGVTITIPLPFLNKLTAAQFDSLVPGLVREKITWYLKALPKQIRRNLVPVPDYVTRFLEQQETRGRSHAAVGSTGTLYPEPKQVSRCR